MEKGEGRDEGKKRRKKKGEERNNGKVKSVKGEGEKGKENKK